ncbi:MAG TPA: hypothetical protein VNI02_21845 [Blastocatellia bacterium]|jgi:hypothetical protein|nr:hypothetical protein [Blastocatellia bacterium]
MRHTTEQFERGFPTSETVAFENGNVAFLIKVRSDIDPGQVLHVLGLPQPRALLIINGGTGDLTPEVQERVGQLFRGLAQLIASERIDVITGGTRAGIFEIFGEALGKCGGPTAPCIGVLPANRADLRRLEPHHSHFVLVEGMNWGEETEFMYRLADARATGRPSLALFAGGGEVALKEMQHNVAQGREMIFIGGSQGSTDRVLQARADSHISGGRLNRIRSRGRVTLFDTNQEPDELISLVRSRLLDS